MQGSPIEWSNEEFGEKMPDKLLLKPDLSTIKEVPWHKKEAMVFADVYSPDTKELI